MINLKKINEENLIQALDLKLTKEKEKFVSHPVRSLALAYVYRDQCQPFGLSNRIALTCNKENAVALRLYGKFGFIKTGIGDDDEIELVLQLGEVSEYE